MTDAPLDMRMNGEDVRDARQIVNTWSYEELKRILYDYGEERFAPRIAAAICRRREQAPIETTLELVDVIKSAMPASALREKQHPAKRSFQAIRIAVNDELGAVETVMKKAVPLLNPGGPAGGDHLPFSGRPHCEKRHGGGGEGLHLSAQLSGLRRGKKPQVRIVTRKPIVSGEEELERNPRARSAKLRICEKL